MRIILWSLVVLITGAVLGGWYVSSQQQPVSPASLNAEQARRYAEVMQSSPFIASQQAPQAQERLQQMEQRMQMLEQRVAELETNPAVTETAASSLTTTNEETAGNAALSTDAAVNQADNRFNQLLSIDVLQRAGLDEQLANDIVRRRNQLELQKLELRDRALREGYMGTQRYNNELAALDATDISLREEIGETAYDRYLYVSGQSNRVKVASVMLGSSAEQSGIARGDVILSYNGQKVYKWNELQQATSGGELGEYVNVEVLRDGSYINLWLPRGPLGVRLGSARLDPDS